MDDHSYRPISVLMVLITLVTGVVFVVLTIITILAYLNNSKLESLFAPNPIAVIVSMILIYGFLFIGGRLAIALVHNQKLAPLLDYGMKRGQKTSQSEALTSAWFRDEKPYGAVGLVLCMCGSFLAFYTDRLPEMATFATAACLIYLYVYITSYRVFVGFFGTNKLEALELLLYLHQRSKNGGGGAPFDKVGAELIQTANESCIEGYGQEAKWTS